MDIQLSQIQQDVLDKYAIKNGITATEYATNIISSWINSQINGFYIDKIKCLDNDELKTKFGKVEV